MNEMFEQLNKQYYFAYAIEFQFAIPTFNCNIDIQLRWLTNY